MGTDDVFGQYPQRKSGRFRDSRDDLFNGSIDTGFDPAHRGDRFAPIDFFVE
jgi:hypothetical protein